MTDWEKKRIKDNDGWGCQFPPEHIIEVGQQVYYTQNHGENGHGFLGGTTLLSVEGENCTIKITGLYPKGCEYDYGTKVHYGPIDSSLIVTVPRKHIFHYEWTRDW